MPTVFEKLQKKYGPQIVSTFGERAEEDVQVVSTGSVSLDFATGIGGVPLGRVIQVFGEEQVGKTSLSYYMIAEHLKRFPDRDAYFLNIEGSFDATWAMKLRPDVDWSQVKVLHPDPGLESVQMLAEIVKSGEASIVVYDSLGAMLDDAEMKEDDPKPRVGRAATLITFLAQTITVPADRNKTTVVLVNQARDDINSMGFADIHTPGGRAVKHMVAMTFKMRTAKPYFKIEVPGPPDPKGAPKKIKEDVGYRTVIKIDKNKAGGLSKTTAFYNFYNRPLRFLGAESVELDSEGMIGIDTQQETLDLALNWGVFDTTPGGYYYHDSFPEDGSGQHRIRGRENVQTFLRESPELKEQIRRELMELAQRSKSNA